MVKRFLQWLRRASPLGWSLTGMAVAFAFSTITVSGLEEVIRTAGVILRLLGLITVAIGLEMTRQFFWHDPFWVKFFKWIRDLKTVFGNHKTKTGSLRGSASGTSGSSAVLTKGRPKKLDERVKRLEREMDELQENVKELEENTAQEFKEVRRKLQKERDERKQQRKELKQTIEKFAVGGIKLEGIGLSWLIIGLILVGFPNKIAKLWAMAF